MLFLLEALKRNFHLKPFGQCQVIFGTMQDALTASLAIAVAALIWPELKCRSFKRHQSLELNELKELRALKVHRRLGHSAECRLPGSGTKRCGGPRQSRQRYCTSPMWL